MKNMKEQARRVREVGLEEVQKPCIIRGAYAQSNLYALVQDIRGNSLTGCDEKYAAYCNGRRVGLARNRKRLYQDIRERYFKTGKENIAIFLIPKNGEDIDLTRALGRYN